MNEDMTEDRRGWHVDKAIPITVLFSIGVLFVGGISGFSVLQTEFREYRMNNDARIVELRKDLEERTKDRIHGSTVDAMFRARDVEITAMKKSIESVNQKVDRVDSKVSDNNRLLHQIWREIPRKGE